jgi:hypothetical protein
MVPTARSVPKVHKANKVLPVQVHQVQLVLKVQLVALD